MSEDNVLYVRQEKGSAHSGDDHDSVWDDTLLIRAYDKAVNSAKQKLVSVTSRNNDESNVDSSSVVEEEGNSPKRKKKHESKKFQRPWKVGNSCRAVYSVDGEEYEAEIIKMLPNVKSCIVKFYGYGNEEQVSLGDLLPSLGKEEIQLQKQCAEEDKANWCVGDVCRAVFSGDGLEYEAEIIKIYAGSNLALIRYVGYGNQEKVPMHDLIPSRGVQEVELQIVKAHEEYAAKSGSRFTVTPVTLKSNSRSPGKGPQNGYTSPTMMMPPPPVPTNSFMDTAAIGPLQPPIFPGIPQANIPLPVLAPPAIEMMLHGPHTETEALTAMLMSWYMSGYHTGYYQGLKHAHMSGGNTNSTDRKSDSIPGKSRNSPPHHHKHHH